MSNRESRIVWLKEEAALAVLVGPMGAWFSTVSYIQNGMEYEVLMENDDFILIDSWAGSDYEY